MNRKLGYLLTVLASVAINFGLVTGFSQSNTRASTAKSFGFIDSIKTAFDLISPKSDVSPDVRKREALKETLLSECRKSGAGAPKALIREIISELAEYSPTPNAASSKLLQKNWLLEWTTEKEINFFRDWNISSGITQSIDGFNLENLITFRQGGGLAVKGILSVPNSSGLRTNFEFTTATLDLGRWGSYNLPPVGKGWFDTIYLDENLRIDTNSRDDILICTPALDA